MSTLLSWVSPVSWWNWWNSTPGAQLANRKLSFATLRQARECGICSEEMRYPRLLDCLHAFCSDCLKKHYSSLRQSNPNFCPALLTCPTCHEDSIVHYADVLTSLRNDLTYAMAEQIFRTSVLASINELGGEGEVEKEPHRTAKEAQAYVRVGVVEDLRSSIDRAEEEVKRIASEVFTFLDDAVYMHEEMRARAHDLSERGERDREAIVETLHREFGSSIDRMIMRERDVFERYSSAKADRLLLELIVRFYEVRHGDVDSDAIASSTSPSALRCFEELSRFDAERVAPKAVYAAARYLLNFDITFESRPDAPVDDEAMRCIGELRNLRGRIVNEAMRRDTFYANAFLFRSAGQSNAESSEGIASPLCAYSTVNKAGLLEVGLAFAPIWRVGQRAPASVAGAPPVPPPLGSFEWCTGAGFLDYTRSNAARGIVCDKMNERIQLIDLSSGVCSVSLLNGLVRPRRTVQLPDERVAICDEFGETLKLFDIRVPGGAPTELGHSRSAGQPMVLDNSGESVFSWPEGDAESEWRAAVAKSVSPISDGTFRCCAGLALTSDGELACADADRGFICTVNPTTGIVTSKFTTRFLDDRYVPHPYFMAVDSSDCYSAAFADDAACDEDDPGRLVSVDANNDVLITSDTTNNVVKLYSRRGRVLNSIGGFRCARGVSADSCGRLYVADADNHRIALHDATGKYLADALDASDGVCYPMSVALNRSCDLMLFTQCGVYTSHKVTLARIDERLDARVDAFQAIADEADSNASQLSIRNPLLNSRKTESLAISDIELK